MLKVCLFILCLSFFPLAWSQAKEEKTTLPTRVISADCNHVKGSLNTSFKNCVGAGRAHEGLRGNWQKQLLEAKKDCDFHQIRFHALFHDEMGVFNEDETGIHLNWQYIDALYDFLVEAGVKPFIELAFTPNQLKSGSETIFWWKGNVTPPNSYDKWGILVEGLAQHLKERYGEDEVANWYFEVWNEPNLSGFFTGTQADYFKLYETAAHAVKEVSARFKVGGPATAGCAWIPELMEYCKTNVVPLDFITTHHYGVEGYLDEFGKSQLRMPQNANSTADLINITCNNVKKSIHPDMEVHFTEWSSSYSPRDPFHDVYQNATYILNTLKKVGSNAASMSYWTFTDIFEEAGTIQTPFHGGFGLMNFQGIKKPTYFAYKFLNELGDLELNNVDASSWACRNKRGDVQLLFWDITMMDQQKESNQVFYKRNLPSKQREHARVEVFNLKPGNYLREVYRIGYKHNDAYTAYYEMGSPRQLTTTQTESLKRIASGEAAQRDIICVDNGTYQEAFPVRENDVFFVKLMKLED